jgi:hypothetical protein
VRSTRSQADLDNAARSAGLPRFFLFGGTKPQAVIIVNLVQGLEHFDLLRATPTSA